jgi:hypothetical protein
MAAKRGRPSNKVRISDEELEQKEIKKDFFEDNRSSNGYIKVSFSPVGASILNKGIDDDIERKQKELEQLRKQRSKFEDIEESVTKKDKKKMKKDKKKKKKEKERLKNLPESSKLLYGAVEAYKDKFFGKDGKNKDGKKKNDYDGAFGTQKKKSSDSDDDDEEKVQRKKEEREKKEFEKRFEEPLSLIRENIIDMSETLVEINDMIKETKESRGRSKHIMLKDLIMAKTSLFSARASSASSMSNIQKTRLDIEMKKVKESSGGMDERTKNIANMNKFFPQLLASGKLSGSKKDKDKDDDRDKSDKKKKKKNRNRDVEEKFETRVTKLINSGEMKLTPHEASIDMEGKYKIIVMKSIKTGDWRFAATDNNGRILKDFKDKHPGLMPKTKHAKMRFDDEKDIAKDTNTDTIYQVLNLPFI